MWTSGLNKKKNPDVSRTAKSHPFGMTARSHALTLHMNFSCKVFIFASSEINKILKRRNSAKAKICSVSMCAMCGGIAPIMCKKVPIVP